MCKNKVCIFKYKDRASIYTCNEVKILRYLWIEEFIEKNGSPSFEDQSLKKYIEGIDNFLDKCSDIKQQTSEEFPTVS